jgi:hypothetical protein
LILFVPLYFTIKIQIMKNYEFIIGNYLNGNKKDFSKQVKRLSKYQLIELIEMMGNCGITSNDAISSIKIALKLN